MVSREHKRVVLHEKLQLLRSVTNSHALNKTSIIVDASKYIQELKQKVERLNEEIAAEEDNTTPMVTVETIEKGFLISVYSEKSYPGLLICVLEAFEELGLNVMEARASCTDTFHLEAVGGENLEVGDLLGDSIQFISRGYYPEDDHIYRKLAVLGFVLKRKLYVNIVLHRYPETFSKFITNILRPTLHELLNLLRLEESSINGHATTLLVKQSSSSSNG